MGFSNKLYQKVHCLWKETSEKSFLIEMAKGTLDEDRFKNYIVQDYLYLVDYIDIIYHVSNFADSMNIKDFFNRMINETRNEIYRVHIPNMEKLGICCDNVMSYRKALIINEYVGYIRSNLYEEGFLACLSALLHCSWIYAYIGKTLTKKYFLEICKSPYKFWFDAYTCSEYAEANRMWIDIFDNEATNIGTNEKDKLYKIFEICARYENKFWDMF